LGDSKVLLSVIIGILIISSLSFVGQNSAHAGSVQDTTPPTITCPADITVQAPIEYANPNNTGGFATATDAVDPNPSITWSNSESGVNPIIVTRTWTATDNDDNSASCVQVIQVDPEIITGSIDIKPQSCPNPIKTSSNGVLPVAILGTDSFDVSLVDVDTVTLEGVSPIKSKIKDVATPLQVPTELDENSCTDEGPDGFDDLTLKFDMQEIVATLGVVSRGDVISVELEGELLDGTPFEGYDIIIIK